MKWTTDFQSWQSWWIGVEGVFDDVVILHEYARPDLPAHKKIIAVDINTGKTLWRNDELVFVSSNNNYLIAKEDSFANTQTLKLKLLTGEILCELSEDEFKNTLKELNTNEKLYYQTPAEYWMDELLNEPFHGYIKKQNRANQIANTVEVLTDVENDIYVIGYSRKVNNDILKPVYDEYVSVLNKRAKILYTDKIVSSANIPIIPKYFRKENILIYIKDKTIFKAVKLFESKN